MKEMSNWPKSVGLRSEKKLTPMMASGVDVSVIVLEAAAIAAAAAAAAAASGAAAATADPAAVSVA